MTPGGVRIGTPAVTTRGMKEAEMSKIAEFIDRVLKVCVKVQETSGKQLKEFLVQIEKNTALPVIAKEIEVE